MTTPQRAEMVKRIQYTMSAAYTGMGAWCLLHPVSVLFLSLTPTAAYQITTPASLLIMRCFGAQAMTTGLLIGACHPDVKVFKAFGLAMLPYLGFNFWFLAGPGRGTFTNWLWMDFVGNVVFLVGSGLCVKLLEENEREEREQKSKKGQ